MTPSAGRRCSRRPDWWGLAYEAETLDGLVAPARAPTFGTIAYIGVVPQQRGSGRIHTLLAWGTAKLLAEGALPIRADTDLANTPMANAFLRAGYHELGSRREFAVRI